MLGVAAIEVGGAEIVELGTQLRRLADLDKLIESLDAEIKERLRPPRS